MGDSMSCSRADPHVSTQAGGFAKGFGALCTVLWLVASARAEPGWLRVNTEGPCRVAEAGLEARIERAVAGPRNSALQVEVELDRLDADARAGSEPTRARVRLWLGGRAAGDKRLEADSCEEALDAVVAVAALALSTTAANLEHVQASTPTRAPLAALATRRAPGSAPAATTAGVRVDQARPAATATDAAPWRIWLGAGIDAGSLAQPTALVTGGAARALQRAELRLLGRYGVRVTDEQSEADFQSVRSEYGAAALDACLGLDRRRWLSFCAGLELRLKRVQRTSGVAGAPHAESSRLEPSLGPGAALALVLRSVIAQPQLELSAQVPVLGAPSTLAFRAALGGGMPF
jgi:hypothetical protein